MLYILIKIKESNPGNVIRILMFDMMMMSVDGSMPKAEILRTRENIKSIFLKRNHSFSAASCIGYGTIPISVHTTTRRDPTARAPHYLHDRPHLLFFIFFFGRKIQYCFNKLGLMLNLFADMIVPV